MIQLQRIVNSMFSSNSYLIGKEGSMQFWLVDVGDVQPVVDLLPEGGEIIGLLLTHTHFDHLYGMNDLHERFPRCVVYTSEYGAKALFSAKLNLSRYHESPIEYMGKEVRVLKDGDTVQLFNDGLLKDNGSLTDDRSPQGHGSLVGDRLMKDVCLPNGDSPLVDDSILTVYETPGHCPSCLTYSVGQYLFTGDSYIPGMAIVTNLPKGDKLLAQSSLERIMALAEGKSICAGHGDWAHFPNAGE